jgi:flagellar export protein FliJ
MAVEKRGADEMGMRKTLDRLERIRRLEEEQSRLELEAAVVERNHLLQLKEQASGQRTDGRRQFAAGVLDQKPLERQRGLMAMEQASRVEQWLAPAVTEADQEVERQRTEFLHRRTARLQVETLADEERRKSAAEVARRAQQMLDDWYGRRLQSTVPKTESPKKPKRSFDEPGGRR